MLGILIYSVGYNLHHIGGKWVNIVIKLRSYMPLITCFYLVTFFMTFFLRKEKNIYKVILIFFSALGLLICFSTDLNPF
jgi:mannose/fructose/N-acetylgalactosamine-specific phosphotransferase system component IID